MTIENQFKMKIFVSFLLVTSLSVCVQAQAEKEFVSALKSANFSEAEKLMNDRVDFCVNEDQSYIKKQDALAKLQGFIKDYQVKSWEVIHKGSSSGGKSSYSVLEASTSQKPIRVLVYSEREGTNTAVSEIRIEY